MFTGIPEILVVGNPTVFVKANFADPGKLPVAETFESAGEVPAHEVSVFKHCMAADVEGRGFDIVNEAGEVPAQCVAADDVTERVAKLDPVVDELIDVVEFRLEVIEKVKVTRQLFSGLKIIHVPLPRSQSVSQ